MVQHKLLRFVPYSRFGPEKNRGTNQNTKRSKLEQVVNVNVGIAQRSAEINRSPAYEAGEQQGLGAVGLDGAMVDRPIYVRALDVLRWQSAIEARAF